MSLDAEPILSDDAGVQVQAIATATAAPEHERSALAAKLAAIAKDMAAALAAAEEEGSDTTGPADHFGRAARALSVLRVEVVKACLLRIADEGSLMVKATLARALRETQTAEGRAVLVHLLSDEDARPEAILAIGVAPWPEVLPALIEVAEADDDAARLAALPIARCGTMAGLDERNAAADFLLEQLDDDSLLPSALDALLRLGKGFPGVLEHGGRLAREPGKRKLAGLCLVAAHGTEDRLLELAQAGARVEPESAQSLLGPMRKEADEVVRQAAERTWKALDLR